MMQFVSLVVAVHAVSVDELTKGCAEAYCLVLGLLFRTEVCYDLCEQKGGLYAYTGRAHSCVRAEGKVAAIELQRLYDERKAAENTPSEQAYNYSEINRNLTILLGIASGQEHAIRLMQSDLGTIKERITSLEGKFEQGFTSLEGKFEQVLQLLTTLTTKLE